MKTISRLLAVAVLMMISAAVRAQIPNLTVAANKSVADLDPSQYAAYQKLLNGGAFASISFINTPDILNSLGAGKIIASHETFPSDNLVFSVDNYEFTDSSNYQWFGYMQDDDSLAISQASLGIIVHNGQFLANISTDSVHLELYDLGNGLTALCEASLMESPDIICSATQIGNPMAKGTSSDPCENVKTKVLVFYTPAAAASCSDIYGTAAFGVYMTNQIWTNSQVDNSVSLAGVVPLNVTESSSYDNDVKNWSTLPFVTAQRNAYGAELVVFFTGDYSGIFGVVKNIGGPSSDAFCIVEAANANNGHHTFSHELNHLYGCHHDNDPTPGYSHGHAFSTGWWIFTKRRFTLMAVAPSNKDKLEQLSNPDISYKGVATGDYSYRNNAQQVRDTKYTVASFYADPTLPLYTSMSAYSDGQCEQTGTATADPHCGTPPYTYQWYYSDNGVTWWPYGNTKTISYLVPLPPNNGTYNSGLLRVVVTDAASHSVTGTKGVSYSCPHHNNPHGGGGLHKLSSAPVASSISPNPTTGLINLTMGLAEAQNVSVLVTDMYGRQVIKTTYREVQPDGQQYQLYMPDQTANGLYHIRLVGSKGYTYNGQVVIYR